MGNTMQKLPQIPPAHPEQEEQRRREQEQELHEQQQKPSTEGESSNEEFTCEICIEPAAISGKRFSNGNRCSHPFCTNCVIKYIRVQLEDNNVGLIKCPAVNCDRTLDPHACAPHVGAPLFVRWCDVLCEAAISGLDRSYCPYRSCSALIVNECGGLGRVKKSECPTCKRWFCFECKRVWHAGFGCEESTGRRDVNDVAFGRLVERRKWMRCPRCRHFVELTWGCQNVRCRCGISFCYRCGNQVHQCCCNFVCCDRCCRIRIVVFYLAVMFLFFWTIQKP